MMTAHEAVETVAAGARAVAVIGAALKVTMTPALRPTVPEVAGGTAETAEVPATAAPVPSVTVEAETVGPATGRLTTLAKSPGRSDFGLAAPTARRPWPHFPRIKNCWPRSCYGTASPVFVQPSRLRTRPPKQAVNRRSRPHYS